VEDLLPVDREQSGEDTLGEAGALWAGLAGMLTRALLHVKDELGSRLARTIT
jgi:hypothetical protein